VTVICCQASFSRLVAFILALSKASSSRKEGT
jgi:hypothetical protein